MRIAKYIKIVFLFVLYSFASNGQNKTIDSLKKILQTQKEDTNKVNTLNQLGRQFIKRDDFENAAHWTRNWIRFIIKL